MITLTLPLFLLFLPAAASDGEAAARFAGGEISMAEFESYIAFRYAKDAVGKEAVEYLIRDAVLAREIEGRGIGISQNDLRRALDAMDAQLREAVKHTLDEELAAKGMDRATFEEIYRKQIACERLVRLDLGINANDPVKPEQQELWLSDRVKNTNIARDGLEPGIFAIVGGARVTAAAVGRTIRLKLSRVDAKDALRRCVGIALVEDRAKAAGIVASAEDVDAAIGRRRERFANDPLGQGLTYDEVLKARGIAIDDLRRDPALRAEALLWKLAIQQFPDEACEARYASGKDRYDGAYGEQRKLSWILNQAAGAPNEFIKKTYAQADEELKQLLPRAVSLAEFGRLATIYSKHEPTKKRAGEIGWVHRREPNYDPALLAAADAPDAPVGKPIGPVRADEGSALIFIESVRPAPDAGTMRRYVRNDLAGEMYKKTVEDANVTTYLDKTSIDGGGSKRSR